MTKRMLIDAAHADEIRIAVVDEERILEYDVQSAEKEQIRGNIYVGEVSRVEPSLQAAFITYGGNRNGFLAFSEIHPQYFNLPEDEKAALLSELIGEAEEMAKADEAEADASSNNGDEVQRSEGTPRGDRGERPERQDRGDRHPRRPVSDLPPAARFAAPAVPDVDAEHPVRQTDRNPRRPQRAPRQDDATAAAPATVDSAAMTEATATPTPRSERPAPVPQAVAPVKKERQPVKETGLEKVQVAADATPETPVVVAPKKQPRQKPLEAKQSVAARSDIQETSLLVVKVPVDDEAPATPAPKGRKPKALAFEEPTITAPIEPANEGGDDAPRQEARKGNDEPRQDNGGERGGDNRREGRRFDRNRGRDRGDRGGDRNRGRDSRRGGERSDNRGGSSSGRFKTPVHRRFEIGKVLKEGQKILVQISKEERGNKGAALTTYISLPGRFTVYMPNTPYAGGVSRKITDFEERKQLKRITSKLEVEKGAGLIVRTAGLGQPQDAIERDFSLLKDHWSKIQDTFKEADEPTLAHEDGSLVVRALRDMVTDDIEEVVIEGEKAYRAAKEFITQINPDFADKIKLHHGSTPIFTVNGVEEELVKLHRTRVNLPSGGYVIINPTEALVSIDVNSGSATQQKSIEDTALATNLEAAEEIARQLRLRDLSGLIVIDFIDMEDNRHERKVEWALRQAIRHDRARTKVGGISEFGLLEMSRQRMRPSLGESMFVTCQQCQGSGVVRSPASAALLILRRLEDPSIAGKADKVIVTTDSAVAIYMLNFRRDLIQDIESKFKIRIVVKGDDRLVAPDHRLELVTMKADGSQATQTMEYHLHDVQESEVKLGGNNRRRRGGKDKPRNGNNGNGNGGQGQQNQRQDAAPSAAEGATEAAPRAEGAAGNEPRHEGNRDRQDRGDRNGRRDRHGRRRDRNDRGGRPQRHEGGERQPQNVQGGTPGNTTEREIRDEDVVQPSPAEQEEQRKSVFQRWWNK